MLGPTQLLLQWAIKDPVQYWLSVKSRNLETRINSVKDWGRKDVSLCYLQNLMEGNPVLYKNIAMAYLS